MKKIALSLFVIATSGAYVWDQSGRQPAGDLLGSAIPAGDIGTGGSPPRAQNIATAQPAVVRQVAPFAAPEAVAPQPADPSATETSVSAANPQTDITTVASSDASTADAPPLPAADATASATVVADAAPPPAAQVSSPLNVPMPRLRPSRRVAQVNATPVAMTVAANGFGYTDGAYTGPVTDAYYGLIQIQAIVQGGRLVGIKVVQYPSDRRTSIAINRQALPMLRDEVVAAQSANVDIISGATLTSEAFIQSLGGALRQAAS